MARKKRFDIHLHIERAKMDLFSLLRCRVSIVVTIREGHKQAPADDIIGLYSERRRYVFCSFARAESIFLKGIENSGNGHFMGRIYDSLDL